MVAPARVRIPVVAGDSYSSAVSTLSNLGLVPEPGSTITCTFDPNGPPVTNTEPPAVSIVDAGSVVQICNE